MPTTGTEKCERCAEGGARSSRSSSCSAQAKFSGSVRKQLINYCECGGIPALVVVGQATDSTGKPVPIVVILELTFTIH